MNAQLHILAADLIKFETKI